MSDAAKNRVIALGTKFNCVERSQDPLSVQFEGSSKKSFWKRNTSKLPGSIKPVISESHHVQDSSAVPNTSGPSGLVTSKSSTSQGTGVKGKPKSMSFQEFDSKMDDAWADCEDDILKTGAHHEQKEAQGQTRTRTISGGEIRAGFTANPEDLKTTSPEHELKKEGSKISRPSPLSILTRHKNQSSSKTGKQTSPPTTPSPPPPVQAPRPPSPIQAVKLEVMDQEIYKLEKFGKLLAGPNTDLEAVRKLSWSGIPTAVRPTTWQLLSGYLPANIDRRQATLDRKREEYHNFVKRYYPTRYEDTYQDTFRQIHIDIPRMNPLIPLFQQPLVQEIFERILYIWAIRHPASGYVQGMNDLVTPFFVVFLSAYVDGDLENFDIPTLRPVVLDTIEADSFWCLSKLLDGIQDNYTFAQPGIQMKVNALRELVKRIDEPLHKHLIENNVEYLQFAFRWMNNILMREMPLRCTIRLWDTYLSEEDGFATFHLYVCAAFLTNFSKEIMTKKDFQFLMVLLQNLPTTNWSDQDVGLILAEAFRLKYMFADAPKHLQSK
ncbi:TBC1 domain family member 22B-like isoform X2 [Actinia tenebrosa]|uniref:TBC1 domain family member 22B-like isoform X2 n=1 Tax=Actinia tenebrosa TaxID=6105 RepID=A0A6P8I2A0_ACTTE|nr:TBC1 domain family member 22B-like isoform X2 [Actinia tenebrosa]